MAHTEQWAIGVDLGGTKTVLARVNNEGRMEQQVRFRTDVQGGPNAVITEIVLGAEDLRKSAGTPPVAIGVGIAGQIDEERGVVKFAPNLGWRDIPFASALATALKLPVVLLNDVRAATWGEWLHGAGRGMNDIVCLFAGTGIGGGVVSGGRMVTGCTNTAGEIGHMTVKLGGPRCTCRNSGCLEALAGGWAIARTAQDAVREDPVAGAFMLRKAEGVLSAVTAEIVGLSALEGDLLARRIIDEAGQALAAGAVSLVNAFNPCRLILGGGVIEGMPVLADRIKEGVSRSALVTAIDRLEVVSAELRHDAGVIGMAAYALRLETLRKQGRTAA